MDSEDSSPGEFSSSSTSEDTRPPTRAQHHVERRAVRRTNDPTVSNRKIPVIRRQVVQGKRQRVFFWGGGW
jgi:hypothetical protein